MRALEHVGLRGHRQLGLDHAPGLGCVGVEQRAVGRDVGVVEVVAAHLVLGLAERLAVGDAGGIGDLLEMPDALKGHQDAFHAVGQLDRDRVEGLPADGLEVGELGDLHAVEPDLPAQPPGTDGRLRPVVLDEADVVRAQIDPERLEAAEVLLLRVAGLGLEDHLVLGVALDAVGVLPVPGVVGAHRRLDVGHLPRLGTEHPQHRRGVSGTGAHLGVHRLDDHRAARGPVLGEPEQGVLHGQHWPSRPLVGRRSRAPPPAAPSLVRGAVKAAPIRWLMACPRPDWRSLR